MLKLQNVCKTFYPGTVNEKQALRGIDLHLQEGDFVTILGSNGAGKSTLFNAIAGSFPIDGGTIRLDGKNITSQPDYKRSKFIGRLFQDPLRGTAPNMTIEENLALAYMRASSATSPFSVISKKDRDPELRYTQAGKAFCTITLAVDRKRAKEGQQTADFIPCVAWDKLAEVIGNNLAKGRRIGIEGRLQTRTYEAKDGSKRSAFDVAIDEMEFLDSKGQGQPTREKQEQPSQQNWTEEIPF